MAALARMVVAVIDGRTTAVCLHAAGQIRPPGQPFDTLAGQWMSPPFHYGCRSQIVPWVPGAVNKMRADANDELLARPVEQRRLGPTGPGPKVRIPGAPAGLDSPAVPVPRRIAARIATAEERQALAAQIDAAGPAAIADTDLATAILNSARFDVAPGGVGRYSALDTVTGQRYVLHRVPAEQGYSEAAASRLHAAAFGTPEVRVADVIGTDGNVWMLRPTLAAGETSQPGIAADAIGKGHALAADIDSVTHTLLGDFVTDTVYRPSASWQRIAARPGRRETWQPAGWPGSWGTYRSSGLAQPGYPDSRDLLHTLRDWSRATPHGAGRATATVLRQRQALLMGQAYDDALAALEAVDLDVVFAIPEEAPSSLRHRIADMRTLTERRIADLRTHRHDNIVWLIVP